MSAELEKRSAVALQNQLSEISTKTGENPRIFKSSPEHARSNNPEWEVAYEGMQNDELWRVRFALGNGILTVKPTVDGKSPLSYVRGLYELKPQRFENQEDTTPAGLNIPDFYAFDISSGEGTKIDPSTVSRTFDMRYSTIRTSYITRDNAGNLTNVVCTQFLSQTNPHMAAARYEITPHYTGEISIGTGINCDVDNGKIRGTNSPHDGEKVDFYKSEKKKKLFGQEGIQYAAETNYKGHKIAVAKKTLLSTADGEAISPQTVILDKKISEVHEVDVAEGQKIIVDTFASVRTDVDQEILEGASYDPESVSRAEIVVVGSYDELMEKHIEAWEEIWGKVELDIRGDDRIAKILRFNKAHALTEVRPGYEWASIAAKKANDAGQGYKNHAFWDGEIFNMNVLTPEQALTMLSYRYRLLDAAREKATAHGYKGAFWPWEGQFANDDPENGEACPAWIRNELGIKVPIEARDEEIHISADIAFAAMEYFWMSNNKAFLRTKGAEMILEAARFYKSRATENEEKDRFEFHGVTGPDEYHMGVDNDAYTNILAKWTVLQAIKLVENGHVDPEAGERLGLSDMEIADLINFADKIYIPYDPATKKFIKFDGWEDVEKIDLKSPAYKDIKTMDARLRAERSKGKDPATLTETELNAVRYTNVLKQHDVLLALAMLGDEIVDVLPDSVKDNPGIVSDIFKANYDEFYPQTCDGSSLSPNKGVELSLIAGNDPDIVYPKFEEVVAIDYEEDTHHTRDGIHTAALGGAEQAVVAGFAGIKATADALLINPRFPSRWRSFGRSMCYRGYPIRVEIDQIEGKVLINLLERSPGADFMIRVNGEDIQFKPEHDGSMLFFLNEKNGAKSPDPHVIFSASE